MSRNIIVAVVVVLCLLGGALGVQTQRVHSLQAQRAALTEALLVFAIERHILKNNPRLNVDTARRITLAGIECARLHGLDRMLLFATMHQESTFDPRAVGPAGERSLMQLTRTTAAEVGLPWQNAFDITANTCAGAAYLAQHVRERGVERGLLRYNGGGAPQYPALVMARYQPLTRLAGTP